MTKEYSNKKFYQITKYFAMFQTQKILHFNQAVIALNRC